MGELDVRILAELFGGREIGFCAVAGVEHGGLYYAARRKICRDRSREGVGIPIALLLAVEERRFRTIFLRIYAGQITRKYSGVSRRQRMKPT